MSEKIHDVNNDSDKSSAAVIISPSSKDYETERLKAFIACTADAIIGFDRDGNITDWNAGAERMFGYTSEEAIGKTYTLIGAPEVYNFQHRVFSETIRGDTHSWYDTRRRRKDGMLLDVSITTSPLIINGEIVGLVGIVRDITEKVQVARELHQRNADLDIAIQQMADLNAQLQATAEEKRRFVNMVIHDLRHPLTSLRTTLYLLRHDDAQRAEYLNAIEGRIYALTNLLNELTEYHRIEAGRTSLQIEPVSVATLVQECITNFAPLLAGGQVTFRCDVDESLIITSDGGRLTHILLNLLSNALKFTAQGTIAVIGRPEEAERWSLIVEDTGRGIAPEIQSYIFDEFYQGAIPPRQDGSGLGLTIAHQLITALQGTMEMHSAPGQGTRFHITFPCNLETRN
jgi:PAS domain S-box-containing protein